MLANLKIARRLAIAVAVPLLLLVGLASYDLSVKWQAWQESGKLGALADGVAKVSRFIHELQKERGASAVFLGSKGAQMRTELPEQRKHSDIYRSPALTAIQGLRVTATGEFKDALDKAEQAVSALDARRQDIEGQKIAAASSSTFFTETIAKLLAVTSEISEISGHGDIAMAVSAYVSFIQGKERAGQERAFAAGVSPLASSSCQSTAACWGWCRRRTSTSAIFSGFPHPSSARSSPAPCPVPSSTPSSGCAA